MNIVNRFFYCFFLTARCGLALIILQYNSVSRADAQDTGRAALSRGVAANDPESSVSESAKVYRHLIKEGRVPRSVMSKAQCVAVFPSATTLAIGVGGTHGDGVAFCRSRSADNGNSGAVWGGPVFLNLTGGSLGLQAGVKSTDIVVFMTRADAKESLRHGGFKMVGDMSAVAGRFEESFQIPPSGIVGYSTVQGAFAGLALAGVEVSVDEDEQRAFYGTYDRDSFFEGPVPDRVKKAVVELKEQLPG